MALVRGILFLLIFSCLAPVSLAQDPVTPLDTEAFLAEKSDTLIELESRFETKDSSSVSDLRSNLTTELETLASIEEGLRLRRDSLQAELTELNAVQATEPADEETPNPIEIYEAQLVALDAEIRSLESVRANYGALLTRVVEQDRRNQLQAGVDARRAEIETIGRQIGATSDETALLELREQLRNLRLTAEVNVDPLKDIRDQLESDLARLGEPPAEGSPPEAPEIAAQRAELQAALIEDDAIIRQSALNRADIDRYLANISKKRRDQFYDELLTRGPTPFAPNLWGSAAQSSAEGIAEFDRRRAAWMSQKNRQGNLGGGLFLIALSFIIALVLFFPTRRWINRRVLHGLEALEPNPARRVRAALVRILARAVPGIVGGFLVYEALRSVGVIDATTAQLARVLWFSLVGLLTTEAALSAIFAPGTPGWRLMPLDKRGAQFVPMGLFSLVLIFFADRVLTAGENVFGGNQDLALLQSAVVSLLMASLYLLLSRKQLWVLSEDRQGTFSDDLKAIGRNTRYFVRVMGVLIIGATAIGYVAMGYFLATRIFLVGGLIVLGIFLRVVVHEAIRTVDAALAKRTGRTPAPNEESVVLFWIGALFDVLIFLGLAPLAAIALGAQWVDVRDSVSSAFFGFQIGNITFSLAQILAGIGVFVLILSLTRFIQRTTEKRLFPKTKMDIGVQNSLRTIIGYIGLVIGVLISISILGFNLASLAFIAGALSLGIGFGLQTIVNNFVSGLILLFERPIKTGDWIVVSSGEGTVKRISVRSTEIETFDRASLIVPNSELISSSVRNWTHKDRWTRMTIPIGVSYNSDPRQVLDILETVVAKNADVLRFPEPFVLFSGFGNSSLDFEVRVFLSDIAKRIVAQNSLRLEIFEAFREAGIEIPFPQQDVHIRTVTGGPAGWVDGDIGDDQGPEELL